MPTKLIDGANSVYKEKKPATGGGYLNPSSIDPNTHTRVTILGESSLGGYELWVTAADNKRKSFKFASEPSREDITDRANDEGITLKGDEKPKPFYAFWVWNYDEEMVQVFQFSQQGLIDPIIANLSDEEISQEPWAYDFKLSTNGLTNMDKRYLVTCVPGKRRQPKVNEQIEAEFNKIMQAGGNLSNLLVGGDPFKMPSF